GESFSSVSQPPAGLRFKLLGEPPVFGLVGVALIGKLLGRICLITLVCWALVSYIARKLTADSGFVHTNVISDFCLIESLFQQGLNLMAIFLAQVVIFVHDNTNISRLAETC